MKLSFIYEFSCYNVAVEQQFLTHLKPRNRRPRASAQPDIVEFVRRRLAFDPDDMQQAILRSTARRGILNCTRQWGKTTVSAAKAVHRAYTVPKCLIVVASPSLRQSGEWMRRAAELLARLNIRKRGDGNNRVSLVLPNGSRIVGLPESEATTRGFSAAERLKQLYSTHSDYTRSFTLAAQRLVTAGLLSRRDAQNLIAKAKAAPIP